MQRDSRAQTKKIKKTYTSQNRLVKTPVPVDRDEWQVFGYAGMRFRLN